MRRLLLLSISAVVLFAAPKPAGIPARATEIAPGTYRFQDKQGHTWIYRQTPFGVARFAEAVTEPRPPGGGLRASVPSADTSDNIRATAQGDTIQFERPGPFGVYRWQRKQSELNEQERAVLRRQSDTVAGQE